MIGRGHVPCGSAASCLLMTNAAVAVPVLSVSTGPASSAWRVSRKLSRLSPSV
ncbi:hypothetical protein PR003_g26817 [Phytophthora rubi]|uniref:RxLR effector protein n=1 Tax=Phytophthora rubi TaxID=129364 RepID=A0A6A3I8C5_9STRA|nr:hypothetical protein PR001_g25389 [Phytophthora rubi]KAE8987689.1 hypothetical protein PR002_g21979 [Phytophthora rubi]KAE9284578.1 hypothetical protein PR003_g26817 [Phytophthora rubi]